MATEYTQRFYDGQKSGSLRSAQEVVPIILDLLPCKSVVDLGCGVGTWLSVFRELGIEDILGIDGDYVNREMLFIPANCFMSHNLGSALHLDRTFGLAMSLEVAEHIPESYSELFVQNLVRLAPVVLFSAAIPLQGGTFHVNEQWPDYWVRRFNKYGYVAIDCLRDRLWNNSSIQPYYSQNIVVFVDKNKLDDYAKLKKEFKAPGSTVISKVHPGVWLNRVGKLQKKAISPRRKFMLWINGIASKIRFSKS